jgi:serine/threonine-protein kinase
MEQLNGRTLRHEMKKRGAMPLDRALDILIQLLSALHEVHGAGIVHRDVKPENIMICAAPRGSVVKLLDFGIAKTVGDPPVGPLAHPTLQGACVGTPRYAAPEQIGGGPVDGRVDIYAAGMVLYMLVAGRGPFDAVKDPMHLLEAHLNVLPEPPSRFARVPIPPALEAAVMRAIAKRPDDRFAEAASFKRELALVLGRLCIPVGPWLERAGGLPSTRRRRANAVRGLPAPRVERKVAPVASGRLDHSDAEIPADARAKVPRGPRKARVRPSEACRRDGIYWAGPAPRLSGPQRPRRPGAVSGVHVFLSAAAFAAAASSLAMWFVR